EGLSLDALAVLFRSSYHSFDLELELQRHDIPFVKRGGFEFMEAAHIKDVLAHLRLLANPRDAVSWHRGRRLRARLAGRHHCGRHRAARDVSQARGVYEGARPPGRAARRGGD